MHGHDEDAPQPKSLSLFLSSVPLLVYFTNWPRLNYKVAIGNIGTQTAFPP